MFKRTIVALLIIIISISSFAFADEELESPLNLTIATKTYEEGNRTGEYYFLLNWKNPDAIIKLGQGVNYDIDFKEGNNPWRSSTDLPLSGNNITFDEKNMSHVIFDPIEEKLTKENIDIKKNHYSIRIRYSLNNNKGEFSNSVITGITDYYRGSSEWAEMELNNALKLDFITNSIRDNMITNVTREEFTEVLMRMYVKATGKTISYTDTFFSDTENPEILKAAELKIVAGNGNGEFRPNDYVTRQDICTMIYRVIKLLYPETDFNITNVDKFVDEASIDDWALEPMKFMYKEHILKGNGYGKIDPLGNSSREVATILILRTYEKFK